MGNFFRNRVFDDESVTSYTQPDLFLVIYEDTPYGTGSELCFDLFERIVAKGGLPGIDKVYSSSQHTEPEGSLIVP